MLVFLGKYAYMCNDENKIRHRYLDNIDLLGQSWLVGKKDFLRKWNFLGSWASHLKRDAHIAKPHFAKSESAIQESAKQYFAEPANC